MSGVIVCGLLAVVLGADKLPEAALKELKKLEGDWVVQRIETRDNKAEPGETERIVLTLKGDKWIFDGVEKAIIVALDPSAVVKVMDVKSTEEGRAGEIDEAIYKVEDDTLTICVHQGKVKQRPVNFDSPPPADTVLIVLKRDKK